MLVNAKLQGWASKKKVDKKKARALIFNFFREPVDSAGIVMAAASARCGSQVVVRTSTDVSAQLLHCHSTSVRSAPREVPYEVE